MNSTAIPLTLFAVTAALSACQTEQVDEPADLVLHNAYVYTADSDRTVAETVAIRGNEIIYVGTGDGVRNLIGESTELRDMGGAMLMPGIHDMHIHAFGTVEPDMCDLDSQPYSLEGLVPVLKRCIGDYAIAEGDWLIVLQWAFSSGNEPSVELPHIRAALDAVSTEHPIFLYGDDGHHAAANSLALSLAKTRAGEAAGIDAETLRTIYADYRPLIAVGANGEPTGGISEDARLLIRPDWYVDFLGLFGDLDKMLSAATKVIAASGITTLQDPLVTPEMLRAYGRLEQRGEMTFRFRAAMDEPRSESIDAVETHLEMLGALRDEYASYEFVSADGVKLFADAVLEGNPLTVPPTLPVAAVLNGFRQPVFGGSVDDGTFDIVGYVDPERDTCLAVQAEPDAYSAPGKLDAFVAEHGFYPQQCNPYAGVLEHSEDFIRTYIRKATEAGFHVHVHALADKAVRIAVDEFARVKDIAERNATTQSLAHVQLVHPDDQERIGRVGISIVPTLVWATPNIGYDMMVIPFVEEVDSVAGLYDPNTYYMQNVYPARSIQEYGGNVVHGSDAPVDSRDPRPFASLQQAIYRGNGEVFLNPDEGLDIHSAIAAFTINGARLFGHDASVGSIEVGKKADIIALRRNIVELAETGRTLEIGATEVTLTVFDGEIVFEALQ